MWLMGLAFWLCLMFGSEGIFWAVAKRYWYILPLAFIFARGLGFDGWYGLVAAVVAGLVVAAHHTSKFAK